MDGNGRWANLRTHSRVWGHIRGAAIIPDLIEEADRIGLEQITLFSFSTENWSRPVKEIQTLFKILKSFIVRERDRIIKNNVKFNVVGSFSRLPEETQKLVYDLERDTKNNSGLRFNVAFDYGSRREIVDGVNKFYKENPGKEITEELLQSYLYDGNSSDIDLLIRTGGEQRISNFLLWQAAYSELYFSKTKWPDFTCKEFREILFEVSGRERRFGCTKGQNNKKESDFFVFAKSKDSKKNKRL